MVRSLFALCFMLAPGLTAQADPVTAQQAMKELRDREAYIRDSVLIFGEPMISAEYQDQGYRLVLSQCSRPDYACNIAIFSGCQKAAPLDPSELTRLANEMNRDPKARGTVFADRDGGIGDVICIRHRRELQQEDRFDIADVFAWHTMLIDFTTAIETAKRDRQVRDLLGIDERQGETPARPASPPRP